MMYLVVLPMPLNRDDHDAVHMFEDAVIERYGGYTKVNGFGGWRDPQGRMVRESVWRYEIAAAGESEPDNFLSELLARVGRMMGQDAMFWAIVPCTFYVQRTVELPTEGV
jgi:hypothetical protein